jgi:hypothetical protein
VAASDGEATATSMIAAIRTAAPYFIARKKPDMIVSPNYYNERTR